MADNKFKVINLRSNELVELDGESGKIYIPKVVSADDVEYGEIAVNYHKDYENIQMKNDDGKIVLFDYTKSKREDYEESIETKFEDYYTTTEVDEFFTEKTDSGNGKLAKVALTGSYNDLIDLPVAFTNSEIDAWFADN